MTVLDLVTRLVQDAVVLKASIASFGLRFDRLIEISSKGVHADVSRSEAEQCAIQTYLVVGDLLRLADGTSALFVESEVVDV